MEEGGGIRNWAIIELRRRRRQDYLLIGVKCQAGRLGSIIFRQREWLMLILGVWLSLLWREADEWRSFKLAGQRKKKSYSYLCFARGANDSESQGD